MFDKRVLLAVVLFGVAVYACSAGANQPAYEQHAKLLEQAYEVPPGLLRAIIQVESNWNEKARGAHGEVGVGQIKPSTVALFSAEDFRPSGGGYLLVGSKGPKVRKIQAALDIPQSGVFDEPTRQTVVLYQTANKLLVDGIVGPQTWGSLFNESLPGVETVYSRLQDPYKNIALAAKYLHFLRAKTGATDPISLACLYNGGDAAKWCSLDYIKKVDKQLTRYRDL